MSKIERCGLAIVGAGILGLVLALRAAKMGLKKIIVFDAPDKNGLGSDTQRNHAWYQSGLLYASTNWTSAAQMRASGMGLHQEAGIEPSNLRGVFRISQEQESPFLENARSLSLEVESLSDAASKKILGAFHQSGFQHYWVPDNIFKEGRILNALAYKAADLGVEFRQTRVTVAKDGNAKAGYLLETAESVVEPQHTVLCAGAGMIGLLDKLAVQHPLNVSQSTLLVLRCGSVMQTPLLVDLSTKNVTSGLSVAQHFPSSSDLIGRCVLGNRRRRQLSHDEIQMPRIVLPEEDGELRQLVPSGLSHLFAASDREHFRVTAGFKTEAIVDGRPSIDPWISSWPEFRGLLAAVPGKATLSYYVSTQILDLIETDGTVSNWLDEPAPSPSLKKLPQKHLHHDSKFDGVLDEIGEGIVRPK